MKTITTIIVCSFVCGLMGCATSEKNAQFKVENELRVELATMSTMHEQDMQRLNETQQQLNDLNNRMANMPNPMQTELANLRGRLTVKKAVIKTDTLSVEVNDLTIEKETK